MRGLNLVVLPDSRFGFLLHWQGRFNGGSIIGHRLLRLCEFGLFCRQLSVNNFLRIIPLFQLLRGSKPPGFYQGIVILDYLCPRQFDAGTVRLIVANAFAVSPDMAHKVMGKCVIPAANAIFIFQKIQRFLCGVGCLVEGIYSGLAAGKIAAAGQVLIDLVLCDEALCRWQLRHLADIFPPGKGVFLQRANQLAGVIHLKPHHTLIRVAGIPEGVDLPHNCLIGFRLRQENHQLFRFLREPAPEGADDAHMSRFNSFFAHVVGHIPKLLRKLALFKGAALCQLHIGGKLPLFQQLANPDCHILPRENLGVSGIPGGVAIGQVHTVLGVPRAHLYGAKLQAVTAVIGLFQKIHQIVHWLLFGVFNGNPCPMIFRVAAIAEKLVNILLGHGKSGGCDFCTLRFGDIGYLLGFRGEERELFTPDKGFVCQA